MSLGVDYLQFIIIGQGERLLLNLERKSSFEGVNRDDILLVWGEIPPEGLRGVRGDGVQSVIGDEVEHGHIRKQAVREEPLLRVVTVSAVGPEQGGLEIPTRLTEPR